MSANIPEAAEVLGALEGQEPWYRLSQTIHGLTACIGAKGIDAAAIHELGGQESLGPITDTYLLGNHGGSFDAGAAQRQDFLNFALGAACARELDPETARRFYDGTPDANAGIIQSFTGAAHTHEKRNYGVATQRQFRRNGASRTLWTPQLDVGSLVVEGEPVGETPIAIVGAGASGVISAAVLSQLGFRRITLFDKHGRMNGLWKQKNVSQGTKNNPFPIQLNDVVTPQADPFRIERSGLEIDNYLTAIARRYHNPGAVMLRKAQVTSIEPGDLAHRISFTEDGVARSKEYPLAVYAPGIGKPLTPNDPSRMATPLKPGEVGERWQRQFRTPEDFRRLGNMVILVGLGNSTAEILYQLQKKAPHIDYRVLTHRSQLSVEQSEQAVDGPRLYRAPGVPELSSLAGDLLHINDAVRKASHEGKIITDVQAWEHDGQNHLTVVSKDGARQTIEYGSLFTLIGYGQDSAVNAQMGLATRDERTGSIYYDFDGEVQRSGEVHEARQPRDRVYPGYFALGPILRTPENPNALVIPGIQYQVQLLAYTLAFRAVEAALRRR